MAISSIPFLFYPSPPAYTATGTTPFLGNGLTLAAGNYVAYPFQAPETGTITGVGFRTGTVGTGCTVDVRLETIDSATGSPTNTLVGTNTNITQVVANTDDNIWFNVVFTSGASVTKGQVLALVFRVSSGTPASFYFKTTDDSSADYPFALTSSSTRRIGPNCAAINYGGTYYPVDNMYPFTSITTRTFNNTSTPDVRGVKFSLPVPLRVCGCWVWTSSGGDFSVKLYNSDGVTVLASIAWDKDYSKTSGGGVYKLRFTAAVELSANVSYRLAVEPSTSTDLDVYEYGVSSAALMGAAPCGSNFMLTTAKDPTGVGSWTDTSTSGMYMGLMIDGFSDGAGAAGMLVAGGMTGGMRS